jgi:hypothetical protein
MTPKKCYQRTSFSMDDCLFMMVLVSMGYVTDVFSNTSEAKHSEKSVIFSVRLIPDGTCNYLKGSTTGLPVT